MRIASTRSTRATGQRRKGSDDPLRRAPVRASRRRSSITAATTTPPSPRCCTTPSEDQGGRPHARGDPAQVRRARRDASSRRSATRWASPSRRGACASSPTSSRLAVAEPRATKLVCAADKLHNLRCTVADVRREGPSRDAQVQRAAGATRSPTTTACVARRPPRRCRRRSSSELDAKLAELKMLLALPLRRCVDRRGPPRVDAEAVAHWPRERVLRRPPAPARRDRRHRRHHRQRRLDADPGGRLRAAVARRLDALVAAVPPIAGVADVEAETIFSVVSGHLTPAHWLALARRVQALRRARRRRRRRGHARHRHARGDRVLALAHGALRQAGRADRRDAAGLARCPPTDR